MVLKTHKMKSHPKDYAWLLVCYSPVKNCGGPWEKHLTRVDTSASKADLDNHCAVGRATSVTRQKAFKVNSIALR